MHLEYSLASKCRFNMCLADWKTKYMSRLDICYNHDVQQVYWSMFL